MKKVSSEAMNKTILAILPFMLLVLLVSGCSSLNGTRLEGLLGGDVNLVKLGDKVADKLSTQSFPPLFPRQPEKPVLVATLVNNNNLADTSNFGRTLQNHIATGLVARGYAVKEMKLRHDLLVQAQRGEFMLSRHLSDLVTKQRAQAVVIGTYSMSNRVMYLSVRLVSPENRTIRSSYEDKLYLDENTLRLLNLQFADKGDNEAVTPPSEPLLDKLLYW